MKNKDIRAMLTGEHLFLNQDFYKIVSAFEESLGKEQFKVRPVFSVPKRLGSTQSPTWVVQDERGDHVFEALENPASLFSQYGAFIYK
ncbi:MAG: hypothetical protein KDD66_17435 [Bdellovibrionales bacterium]|nr:hypothetical protein [Bdellovibrionales bacterium]